jgi:hypothetical protein
MKEEALDRSVWRSGFGRDCGLAEDWKRNERFRTTGISPGKIRVFVQRVKMIAVYLA